MPDFDANPEENINPTNTQPFVPIEKKKKKSSIKTIALLITVSTVTLLLVGLIASVVQYFTPPEFNENTKRSALEKMESRYSEKFTYVKHELKWDSGGDKGFVITVKNTEGNEYDIFAQIESGGIIEELSESYGCYKFKNYYSTKYNNELSEILGSDYSLELRNTSIDRQNHNCNTRVSNPEELIKNEKYANILKLTIYVVGDTTPEKTINYDAIRKTYRALQLLGNHPTTNPPLIIVSVVGKNGADLRPLGTLQYSQNKLLEQSEVDYFNSRNLWPLTLENVERYFNN